MFAAWDALAQIASEPNPFYESWYLLPSLERSILRVRCSCCVLKADGHLVGSAAGKARHCAITATRAPHLRNWTHANCFLGAPLVAPGFEQLFWQQLLGWRDEQTGMSLFLHLAHMPRNRSAAWHCAQKLGSQTRAVRATVACEERAALVSRAVARGLF